MVSFHHDVCVHTNLWLVTCFSTPSIFWFWLAKRTGVWAITYKLVALEKVKETELKRCEEAGLCACVLVTCINPDCYNWFYIVILLSIAFCCSHPILDNYYNSVASYYNARGLFVCLFPIQIGAAAAATRTTKRAMPTEGRLGKFLGDRHATTCPVAEERVKYIGLFNHYRWHIHPQCPLK